VSESRESSSAAGATVSEEEVREYVRKLREAPAGQILGDVLLTLLNSAQVKLGRRDARLFIDSSAWMLEKLRGYLPDELAKQAEHALGELRFGQVQAESDAARSTEAEPNDLDHVPALRDGGTTSQAPPPAAAQPKAAKLWVPGRDF
jgi:hypothetical protein